MSVKRGSTVEPLISFKANFRALVSTWTIQNSLDNTDACICLWITQDYGSSQLDLNLKNIPCVHMGYTMCNAWDKYKWPIPRVIHGTSISQTYIRQCLSLCEGQVQVPLISASIIPSFMREKYKSRGNVGRPYI